MSDMFLLFEWTEEREAKNHIGIFSSINKAKDAAQIDWDNSMGASAPLTWGTFGMEDGFWTGMKGGDYNDTPYEIEPFTVDQITFMDYGPGTDNPTITRTQL